MSVTSFRAETSRIMDCFFYDGPVYETDGPDDDDATRKVATKLRELGDLYEETVIQPLIKNMQKTPQGSFTDEFSNSVEYLCNLSAEGSSEVASELLLLKATMSLALYVKNHCPEIKRYVHDAVVSFVNNHLQNWILDQGGWDHFSR